MKSFRGKNVLITGGSSGMGLAAAIRFLDEGAKVIITGRDHTRLEKVKTKYPEIVTIVADAAKMEDIRHVTNYIKTSEGTLDVLFANAGLGFFKPFEEVTENDFKFLVNVNFKGVFFTIQEALPLMPDGSSIIVNASWTYRRGLQNATLYSSTKAAIASLVRSLSMELAGRRIRVNAISPGYINTGQFNERALPEEDANALKAQVPYKRFGETQEIAELVYFLASDKASYLNGQDIVIDGGLTAVHNY